MNVRGTDLYAYQQSFPIQECGGKYSAAFDFDINVIVIPWFGLDIDELEIRPILMRKRRVTPKLFSHCPSGAVILEYNDTSGQKTDNINHLRRFEIEESGPLFPGDHVRGS